ncbi:hypothetical protein EVAR_8612_1 [Eumeta japonica]|uniref:Uncharacterized protein n=1 Tax=Eumeta variegata TaxID=151549 RepID=A0A4C1XGG1_EUMVA|nr:hypothetical protein EVAR_8612_1 [Eumeta japonica]
MTGDNTGAVRLMIETNKKVTYQQIEMSLGIGMSQVTARIQIRGGNPIDDSVNYGLYGGRFIVWNPGSRSYPLYMVCANLGCALTCKTTREARRQDVINLSSGNYPESVECDTNVNVIPGRPREFVYLFLELTAYEPIFMHNTIRVSRPPVISVYVYVAVNLLLYLQLLFATCAVLLAVVVLFLPDSALLRGLHEGKSGSETKARLALQSRDEQGPGLRLEKGFACVRKWEFILRPRGPYSLVDACPYNLRLLVPAVVFSLASVGLAFIRADYARKDVRPLSKS